jgi:Ca2+-binding EF-hand superfamily protein
LTKVLHLAEEEVTSARLDRLFNILDQYKRSFVGYEDFCRVLAEDFERSENLTITAGRPTDKDSFNWMLNA